MIAILLFTLAAVWYFWPQISAFVSGLDWKKLDVRLVGAALLVAAGLAFAVSPRSRTDEPTPVPSGPLDLRGTFVGPSASSDAATISALVLELADELELDGMNAAPLWSTGVAIDDLRRRAREFRCRGESIGERQPAARDLIAAYLDNQVGTSGGPVTPEQRAAWISALRDIGRAAGDASR